MEKDISQKDIKKALIKKALGYNCDEVVEEFCVGEDGECTLSKRKVTKKYIPPDISSAKLLLQYFYSEDNSDLEKMTDKELLEEKKKLLELIEKEKEDAD